MNCRRETAVGIEWQTASYCSSNGYIWKNKATYCVPGMAQDNELGTNINCFICSAKLPGFYPQSKVVTLKRFEIDDTTVSCFKSIFLNSEKVDWIRLEAVGEVRAVSNANNQKSQGMERRMESLPMRRDAQDTVAVTSG